MAEIAKPNFHAGAEVIRAQAAKIEEQSAALTAAEARIKAAVAAEREACAQIAYRVCAETRHVTLGDKAAAEIRSRNGGNADDR